METYKKITREALKTWIDEGKEYLLIHTLPKASYEVNHLPTAVHIDSTESDFLDKVSEATAGKDQPVVVYCSSFTCERAPAAAEKLVQAGYTNVYDFAGGLADWQDAGYPMEGV